jgi:soluble lytic murein transglycosylase-like protein
MRAVMSVGSVGDVRALLPKGAMDLVQVMPAAWAGLLSRSGVGADLSDTYDNIWTRAV